MRQIVYSIILLLVFQACKSTAEIKDGNTAYALKKYSIASNVLQNDLDKTKTIAEKSELLKKIAFSYDMQNDFEQAELWYTKLYQNDKNVEHLIAYIKALMKNEKYTDCKEVIDVYLKENKQDKFRLSPFYSTINAALEAQKNLENFYIKNLENINTNASEYSPQKRNDVLWYTSHHLSDLKDDWMNQGYADIKKSNIINNDFSNLSTSTEKISFNTRFHDAEVSFTSDGQTAYFTRCGTDSKNNDFCHIFTSSFDGLNWSEPIPLKLLDDTVNVGQPSISLDGKQLYFSTDFSLGYGGKDIYVSTKLNDTTWSTPINLGAKVNTPYNEVFPYITNNILYFSSDKLDSYGGLDIYSAERQGKTFINLQHFPFGINSGRDDFGWFPLPFTTDSTISEGYMTSNRNGGKGNDDIYYVVQKMPKPPVIPPVVFQLKHYVFENIYETPDNPNTKVVEKKPLDNVLFELLNENNINIKSALQEDGQQPFISQLDSNSNYKIILTKEGFLSAEAYLNTTNTKYKQGDTIYFTLKTTLKKIYKNVEIVLDNIYYDYDKWDIREDAKPTLDTLVEILQQNPTINIELASHTDSRGSASYNESLSQKRAESAVAYIISKGITSNRLIAKGYGESKPVNKCVDDVICSEAEYQQNRRTTFKIID